jgi:hypothetical protein
MVFDLNRFNDQNNIDQDGFLYVLEDGYSTDPIV